MPYEYQFKDRGTALQAYKMARPYYNRDAKEHISIQNSTIVLDADDACRLENIIEKFNASCKRRRSNSAVPA